MVSFVLSFFPRDVLDEIWNLTESVSDGFPTYSSDGFPTYSSIDGNVNAILIFSNLNLNVHTLFTTLYIFFKTDISCS